MPESTIAGARAYTPFTLKLYDWWVLTVSNRYAWRCPTKPHLLNHFLRNMGENHLDIGVGTGYYLSHAPAGHTISLLDLNPDSLHFAAARAGEKKIDAQRQHNVYSPFPADWQQRFDSISLFYLLHCLNGNMLDKGRVIDNTAMALKDGGVLYGATILADGVSHNAFGRWLINLYNKKGIFSNLQDGEAQLRQILSARFRTVDIRTVGTVALFSATGPGA